jgi:anti-anti-sigma factor
MEFKIDTKPAYTLITPEAGTVDANLAAALTTKCRELMESGSANFIIDLKNCSRADVSSSPALAELHEQCYGEQHSLVFTGLQEPVLQFFREQELHETLHITPTLAEAVDIVSMEILERDLFGED